MSITKEDIDQLDNWLDALHCAEISFIENSSVVSPPYYQKAYEDLNKERIKMLTIIDKLRDHFGVEE